MIFRLNKRLCIISLIILLALTLTFSGLSLVSSIQTDGEITPKEITLPVLMYHHILNDSSKINDYVITTWQFEDDLRYIQQKGYNTISIAELIAFIEGEGDLPENPILITFDDGFESFYSYAFPLLKKYNAKAVVSIIGKHTDIFSNPEEPHGINYSHLSWDEIKELSQSGLVEIGNHTYDLHGEKSTARFGVKKKQSENEEQYKNVLLEDIGGLNEKIIETTGSNPLVFAYPFGVMTDKSKEVLEELEFKVALTCEEKVNTVKIGSNYPCYLKRFNRSGKYQTYKYFKKMGL